MMATDLETVSRTEETSLILGTYVVGPMVSGITICLLFCLFRFAIRNTKNQNITQYLMGIFSMLFTILLNISYCILGTDLIVPWNDNISVEGDYDRNTMLEFTSLCIFLWYFGKLLFYISFIYYTYSFIELSYKIKLYLKLFMFVQIVLTLTSIGCLIYLNHNIYQIAITPSHNIQLITQLKGYFFYKNHTNSLTEISSMVPILTDISCLMVLFKLYIERSHSLQFENHGQNDIKTKKFIDLCVRSIMLLFCGSLPTWILFINIFMKSSIIWILLPYDMLINNVCLFLMYNENFHLYKLFCLNCHKTLFNQCFWSNNASEAPIKLNDKSISSHEIHINNNLNHMHKMDGLRIKEPLQTDDDIEIDLNNNTKPELNNIKHDASMDNVFFHINDNNKVYAKSYDKPSLYPQNANHVLEYINHIQEQPINQHLKVEKPYINSMTSSGSNIIKAIVMGKKKKDNKMDAMDEKQHFENGTETYESTDGCNPIMNNGNPFINGNNSSETSLNTYNISITDEQKPTQNLIPINMNKINPFFQNINTTTTTDTPTTDTTMSTITNAGMMLTVMKNSNTKNSNSGMVGMNKQLRKTTRIQLRRSESDHDTNYNTTTTNTVSSRKRKYVHRRNTIDIATHMNKESKGANNVAVPSFGHDVHFSFFE